MNDKVKCQICGEELKQIHWRHLKRHKLTFEQYKIKFPNAPLVSEASTHKRSSSMMGRKVTWSDKIAKGVKQSWSENKFQGRTGIPLSEESKKALSQKLMDHPVSEETRRKIGESGLGRTPWNKGITKDDDERLQSVSEKVRAWNKQHMTDDVKRQISQTLKAKYAEGMKIPHSKGNIRHDLNMYFRSTWEANYARVLNLENIPWSYEKKHFKLLDESGEILAVYTPDFFTDKNIEVKGHADSATEWECNCSRCERDKLRIMLFLEQYPDEKFEMIGRKEYAELAAKYSSSIPHWEKTSRG